jgi:two-component system, NarL family, response regulator DesR
MIRVLIAEDQSMVRGAIVALLGLEPDIVVVAEAGRGDQVTDLAVKERPDVALLDIEMPGEDGIAVAARLRTMLPACRVIILTTFGRPGYLTRAMENGAVGFVTKDAPATQLADAIRRVMKGERVIDSEIALSALRQSDNPLTPRERDVLTCAGQGSSIAGMAESLFLSEGTVRNYLSTAIRKLGAINRVDAWRKAKDKGWLP